MVSLVGVGIVDIQPEGELLNAVNSCIVQILLIQVEIVLSGMARGDLAVQRSGHDIAVDDHIVDRNAQRFFGVIPDNHGKILKRNLPILQVCHHPHQSVAVEPLAVFRQSGVRLRFRLGSGYGVGPEKRVHNLFDSAQNRLCKKQNCQNCHRNGQAGFFLPGLLLWRCPGFGGTLGRTGEGVLPGDRLAHRLVDYQRLPFVGVHAVGNFFGKVFVKAAFAAFAIVWCAAAGAAVSGHRRPFLPLFIRVLYQAGSQCARKKCRPGRSRGGGKT